MDPLVVITALAMYLYNTEPREIIDAVYGADIHREYRAEKLAMLKRYTFASFWGTIDLTHQRRFVDAVMAEYGDEAARRVASEEAA